MLLVTFTPPSPAPHGGEAAQTEAQSLPALTLPQHSIRILFQWENAGAKNIHIIEQKYIFPHGSKIRNKNCCSAETSINEVVEMFF